MRQRHVAADVGVERVAQHRLGDVGHPRDVDQLLDRRVAHVAPHRLRDVDRQVADPLEVGVDLDRRDDRPQVDGHRLVQRQQLEAAAVDLDVQLVDRPVAGQHPVDHGGVAFDQPLDRRADPVLGQPAHLEQPRLELFQLLLKMRHASVRP